MPRPPVSYPVQAEDGLITYSEGDGPFFVTHKEDVRPVKVAKAGLASTAPTTISALLEKVCGQYTDRKVFFIEWPEPPLNPEGKTPDERMPPSAPVETWMTYTYGEVFRQTQVTAKAFMALGHQVGETVSGLGYNNPCLTIGYYAAIYAGGFNTGLYATDSGEQITYKLVNSETSIVLTDTELNYKRFLAVLDDCESIKAIVVWKDVSLVTGGKMTIKRKNGTEVTVITWEALQQLGEAQEASVDEQLKERVKKQDPGGCCSLVFTSGTTGNPKAVMISHDNIIYQGLAMEPQLPPEMTVSGPKQVPLIMMSFLPNSHIAGMLLDVFGPILMPSLQSQLRFESYFARSYDLRQGGLLPRLQAIRPTVFFGVPRIWEKFAEGLKAKAPKSGLVASISRFAKGKMLTAHTNQQMGGNGSKPFFLGASKSVLSKVHKILGLDRVVLASSGAAPMRLETLQYWASLGFNISEAYGMSENTGPACCGTDVYRKWGTCGVEVVGTEFKAFKVHPDDVNNKTECPRAENVDDQREEVQGELCFRGRHVMLGYLSNPKMGDEHEATLLKKNQETIDKEGWLHSGDKGFITKSGVVKVTGRYKEIIIGAGGENIAPVPIEDDLKARCPVISNIMMVGDQRKYNTCLITLLCEGANGAEAGTDKLIKPVTDHTKGSTISEAVADADFTKYIVEKIKETNSNGKVIMNNTFKIQKFTILPTDFSVDGGELTATMKLKRDFVAKKYAKAIDAMYAVEDAKQIFVPYEA